MHPKKRRKLNLPDAEPGIKKRHLIENFSAFPQAVVDVKNGYVLHLFLMCDKSRSETERRLRLHYSNIEGQSFIPSINSAIKAAVNSYGKFKKPSDKKEFEKFVIFCNEHFSLVEESSALQDPGLVYPAISTPPPDKSVINQPIPSTSATDVEDKHSCSASVVSTPHNFKSLSMPDFSDTSMTTRARSQPLTPHSERLRKRLAFVSKSLKNMKKKYQENVKSLKEKLKTPRRCINQAIERKNKMIATRDKKIKYLEQKLQGDDLFIELKNTKLKLQKLQNTHNKLKNRKKKTNTVSRTLYNSALAKIKEKDSTIRALEDDKLQEKLDDLESEKHDEPKVKHKTYSTSMRLKVFDCIANKVPTARIPVILTQFQKRSHGEVEDVPKRSAVELMAWELGCLAELQTAEVILAQPNTTLGFDAATQEDTHINEIPFTTKKKALSASVEELTGGPAEDYSNHICQTVDSLAKTYVYFNEDTSYQDVRSNLIKNITNSMSDGRAAKHAACKNRTVEYLDGLTEERREFLIKKAIALGRVQRDERRKKQKEPRNKKKKPEMIKSGKNGKLAEKPGSGSSSEGLSRFGLLQNQEG